MNKPPIAIAIHGGAGVLTPGLLSPQDEDAIHEALRQAIDAGHRIPVWMQLRPVSCR